MLAESSTEHPVGRLERAWVTSGGQLSAHRPCGYPCGRLPAGRYHAADSGLCRPDLVSDHLRDRIVRWLVLGSGLGWLPAVASGQAPACQVTAFRCQPAAVPSPAGAHSRSNTSRLADRSPDRPQLKRESSGPAVACSLSARWVKPELLCVVQFAGWRAGGWWRDTMFAGWAD